MNEIVAQLSDSIGGTGGGLMESYCIRCVAPGAAVLVCAALLLLALRDIGLRPWNLLARIGAGAGAALILGAAAWAFALFDVGGYLAGNTVSSTYIDENYADPAAVELTFPARKRNLIYIWLESVETTYADGAHGGVFEDSPIRELAALGAENTSFSGGTAEVNGGFAAYGSTWTAGAMFAQTCGLPLTYSISGESNRQGYLNSATGAVALGDILAENGYRQRLRLGSPASFGGRLTYFTQHGGYEICDYGYSVQTGEIGADYYANWGYEDETLFALARQDLTELAAAGEPFNLSILTADTHFPDGYVCRLCGNTFGDDQYSNVFACSSRQVAAFVDWVRQQPFYENTAIVITGDHLTMDADYCDRVGGDYPRRVFTTILNPAAREADPTAKREYTTMDLFPTTLAALGVVIDGERLGLGTNLFSGMETLLERDGLERMNGQLRLRSRLMETLAGGEYACYGPDKFSVDDREWAAAAFKLNETNYIRLEDAALLLRGSAKEFDIRYGLFGRVELLTGRPYSGEAAVSQWDSRPHPIAWKNRTVCLDGERLELEVCESEGSIYLKLRDLAAALDFGVDYRTEGHQGTVVIDTGRGYGT